MARVSMTRTRVWPRILEHVPRLLWNKSIHAAWWSYDIWISQCHLDMMMTGVWCQRVRHQQGWSRNYRVKDRIFLKMYFYDFFIDLLVSLCFGQKCSICFKNYLGLQNDLVHYPIFNIHMPGLTLERSLEIEIHKQQSWRSACHQQHSGDFNASMIHSQILNVIIMMKCWKLKLTRLIHLPLMCSVCGNWWV